jgi:hypothetical protein
VAEGGGLLNRYTLVKAYRGFESLRLRHRDEIRTPHDASLAIKNTRIMQVFQQ